MKRRVLGIGIALVLWTGVASIFLAENAVHIWEPAHVGDAQARMIARQGDASWKPVRITADDGAALDAWLLIPREPNGGGVIVTHGVGDTRLGGSGQAAFLLRAGYAVLMPDSRAHGTSGGGIVTYGVREAGDIHRWADVLLREPGVTRLYGMGQSMGAAVLLQSLACERRFRAVVADCAFVTFEEIAYDRLAQHGIPSRTLSWPLIETGFTYTRVRYGVNLWHAAPRDALRASRTPVLLIHGTADDNIPLRHSRELHAASPSNTELWEVPHAGHVGSLGVEPEQYRKRVLDWFDRHR
jgi:dipeptidyl aminopeptidase/acylaminoacyl peptidase